MITVKAKEDVPRKTLYVRSLKKENIDWLKKDCANKNLKLGEYLDDLLEQLRKDSRKRRAKKSRRSKR